MIKDEKQKNDESKEEEKKQDKMEEVQNQGKIQYQITQKHLELKEILLMALLIVLCGNHRFYLMVHLITVK